MCKNQIKFFNHEEKITQFHVKKIELKLHGILKQETGIK